MIKISIHDYDSNRLIVAEVPQWILDECAAAGIDTAGEVILEALGLSSSNSEYMLGDFSLGIDVAVLNSGRGYGNNTARLNEFTVDFDSAIREAIKQNKQ